MVTFGSGQKIVVVPTVRTQNDRDFSVGFEDIPNLDSNMVKGKAKVKTPVKVVKKTVVMKRKAGKPKRGRQAAPVFGPVTTIDTAPVSMGNTFQGAKPVVTQTAYGTRVKGRDYLLNIASTATTVDGWTLVAASPLSPACMVTSTIKAFISAYAQYVVHAMAFHYITASATDNQGSVMFYIGKNRVDPGLDTSNDNFLPMVLSDNNTVIGPLWKNMTAAYFPETPWMPTNILSTEGLHEQAPGELFVFTKTTQDVVPGFVLIDYDISFREMQANPKGLTLPVSRMKYTQVAMAIGSTTLSNSAVFGLNAGTLLDGTTVSAVPPGYTIGDVYKVVLNIAEASLGGRTTQQIFAANLPLSASGIITVDDGYTCYGLAHTSTSMVLYSTYYAACSASAPLVWAVTNANALTIPAFISLCGAHDSALLQVNY